MSAEMFRRGHNFPMESKAPHVWVTDTMSSLKQLAAEVSGDNTAARIHVLTTASFPGAGIPLEGSWKKRSPQRHEKAAELDSQDGSDRIEASRERWPNLTVCRDFSFKTVRAVLRRRLAPQCRVLLCVDHIPADLRIVHRVVLAGVDAVLVPSDALARTVHAFGAPASRIVLSAGRDDLALFDRPARSRTGLDAPRILYVGDLEPEAGVADFLPCVVAWAERNPHRTVEILWSGEGCLRGVLEAQPLPANVLQQFPGRMSRDKLAAAFLDCDILAMPVLADPWDDVILEALAAQLPVLGSSRSRAVVELITHGVSGWIFDPFEAGAMARAVALALNTSLDELDQMRAHAAARSKFSLPGLDQRIRRAMQMQEAGPPFDAASLGLAS